MSNQQSNLKSRKAGDLVLPSTLQGLYAHILLLVVAHMTKQASAGVLLVQKQSLNL